MSKKSGFHRQIWPKSVTHLHGVTHWSLGDTPMVHLVDSSKEKTNKKILGMYQREQTHMLLLQ